jgi:sugar phosphate isomerase/epimerase
MKRRNFLKQSSIVTTGFLAEMRFKKKQSTSMKNKSDLIILATNWGFQGDIFQFCEKASLAGYDGIEVWVPSQKKEIDELSQAVKKHGLQLGLLAGGSDKDFSIHKDQFKRSITNGINLNPIYINCHSGKDYFLFEQNKELISFTIQQAQLSGIPIYHETHRGRSLFAGHITKRFIDEIKELRLTLDISHWCNVHESLLGDQADMVNLALSRTDHIHARIGHAEGPQVNDPRAPEWKNAVDAHLSWWDKVVERKRIEGTPITFLTEFGPPSYLPTLPFTNQPVANQWEINIYMMDLLRKRYNP